MRSFPILISILSLLSLVLLSHPVSAETRTWPGAAPCNGTLQDCILGANWGDTVEIATNTTIAESPQIEKSLTLRAAAGFNPVFGPFETIFAFGSAEDEVIAIEGLHLTQGYILAAHDGVATFSIAIRNNQIDETFNSRAAIAVRTSSLSPPYGNVDFEVTGNDITVVADPNEDVPGITIGTFFSPVNTGSVSGNTITMQGGGQREAIEIANGAEQVTADVIGNWISGTDFNSGISLYQFDAGGQLTATVINNLVTGQTSFAGAPAAISCNVSQGSGDFTLVNNTVAGNDRGVLISGGSTATIVGVLANTIIADNTTWGLNVDSDFDSTFSNDSNLLYNNPVNYFVPGPGTLTADPLFDGNSFHLASGSPAIDSGNDALLPAGITTDINGQPRVQGYIVDRGIFETAGTTDVTTFAGAFRVGRPWPNPMSSAQRRITIPVWLPGEDIVRFEMFDARGRRVPLHQPGVRRVAGPGALSWEVGEHVSGIYYARLTTGHGATRVVRWSVVR
jgi:hypothetical protein